MSDAVSLASQSLEHFVSRWENDGSVFQADQVLLRMDVLDQFDRFFPNTAADNGDGSSRPALYRRARALSARLEAANVQLCQSVRSQIQHDAGATALLGIVERLGYNAAQLPQARGLRYDRLDEFLAGVLQFEEPETETVSPANPYSVAYQSTPARHIFSLIAEAPIAASDVLVDLGSGLGHVPLLVSICTGARCVGIECELGYVASATKCARRLNLSTVRFLHENAENADLSTGTVFYLYTPFTGALLRTVIESLRRQAAVRRVRICSLGPCTDVLADTSWLEPTRNPATDRMTVFLPRS